MLEKKYNVYGVAFTHIAVSNITPYFPLETTGGAMTITHFLLNKIPQIKRTISKGGKVALILDEASMSPIHFWIQLATLKFLGVEFYIWGDFAGQFKPIFLDDPQDRWSTMDSSDFMHDLCNGLKINFKKYRRGTDLNHFNFVQSIYPQKIELEEALMKARVTYPYKPDTHVKTTLCVTNRYRKMVNESENGLECVRSHQHDAVFIKYICSEKNKGQPMYIWPGLILQSYSTDKKAKNIILKMDCSIKLLKLLRVL